VLQAEIVRFPTTYSEEVRFVPEEFGGLNGTYFLWTVDIDYKYVVENQLWHNVVFMLCANEANSNNNNNDGGGEGLNGTRVQSLSRSPTPVLESQPQQLPHVLFQQQVKRIAAHAAASATAKTSAGAVAASAATATMTSASWIDTFAEAVLPVGKALYRIAGKMLRSRSKATAALHAVVDSAKLRDASVVTSFSIGKSAMAGAAAAVDAGAEAGAGVSVLSVRRLSESIEDKSGSIIGEITFHNPYGFLPAELYGMLPFVVR
jgi:hypothetical protein